MIICPPELVIFNRRRYLADLAYRQECDYENAAERHERIQLLFQTNDFIEGTEYSEPVSGS